MNKRVFNKQLFIFLIIFGIFASFNTISAQPGRSQIIPNRYICRVSDTLNAASVGQATSRATNGVLSHVYSSVNAFCIQVPPGINRARLLAQRGIIRVEPDIMVYAHVSVPTGINRIDAEGVLSAGIECSNVGIAIIDTGIDLSHPDLNVINNGIHYYLRGWRLKSDNNYADDNGHGTHCAGIAAANGGYDGQGIVGVAPNARLYPVKVLGANGSGSISAIIAGVDWVSDNAETLGIQVANMSLGGVGWSTTLFEAMGDAPVIFTVSAGNSGEDIFGKDKTYRTGDEYVPAAFSYELDNVCTISALADFDGEPGGLASVYDDCFAYFSNYSNANAIQFILPGVSIYSTYPTYLGDGSGYATMSGTSMASPHAAGLIALDLATDLLAGEETLDVDWDGDPTMDWITSSDVDDFHEPLPFADYYIDFSGNNPPTAAFTYLASGLNVTFDASSSSDPDGDTLSYEWDFNSDSIIDATGITTSHDYATEGTYTVTLTVTDDDGATDTSTQDITVSESGGGDELNASIDSYVVDETKVVGGGRIVFGTSTATVIITDENDALVEGATVYGYWSNDIYTTVSTDEPTGPDGKTTSTSTVAKDPYSLTFEVTDIVK